MGAAILTSQVGLHAVALGVVPISIAKTSVTRGWGVCMITRVVGQFQRDRGYICTIGSAVVHFR